ncbi:MAG: alpha/beta fold hydrolase [Candidatus Competibacterales bacterium]
MNETLGRPWLVASLGLALAALAPAAGAALESTPCPMAVANGQAVNCYFFTVPENHDQPDKRQIQLFVAAVQPYEAVPEPDPLIFLAGGPGRPATDFVAESWEDMGSLLHRRQMLYVDQRGTGYSRPVLDCKTLYTLSPTLREDWLACLQRYREEGIDLASYNTVQSARDLAALRRALEVDQWNVLGVSYGTRFALELLRTDPEGVRSLVLDSVLPNFEGNYSEGFIAEQKKVFDKVFMDCAAQAACAKTFPDLRQTFLAIEERLRQGPVVLQYARGDEVRDLEVGLDEFVDRLKAEMFFAPFNTIPMFIGAFKRLLDGEELHVDRQVIANLFARHQNRDSRYALGQHMAISCQEMWPKVNLEDASLEMEDFLPYVNANAVFRDYQVGCQAAALPPIDPAFYQPVRSAIPTLILSGDYDALTPAIWAAETSQFLPNSTLLRFNGVGHDVIGTNACAATLMQSFVADPQATLPVACVQRTRPPQFATDPTPFRGEVGVTVTPKVLAE